MTSPSSLPRQWQPQPAPSLTRSTEPSMEPGQYQNNTNNRFSQPRPSASMEDTPQQQQQQQNNIDTQNNDSSMERARQLSNIIPNASNSNNISKLTPGYQPGYFANRGASSSAAYSSSQFHLPKEQQHPFGAPSYNQLSLDIEELKIKLQSEKSRASYSEEAVIRKDKELDRMREDLERYQREALKGSTTSASLEAELAATKVQLSEALANRDTTMKNYRELQNHHRQVESARETAMQQLQELTHELELVRKSSDEKSQPLTQMLSQLTNRLANIEETRRHNHNSQSRSRSHENNNNNSDSSDGNRKSGNNDNNSLALREMQQNIVDEALSRYESQSQKGRDLQSMLEESEKIKNILKGQLEVAQSQIAILETKFRATAETVAKQQSSLAQRKWLLLQRRWLSQLLREYDLCFKQFPTVLPWFRMPQRKNLRVYVWAIIGALRIVKGASNLSDQLPQFKRFFAVSAYKCSPAAVFRKITTEIDQLMGNSNSNHSNSSPLAHLPNTAGGRSNNGGTLVVHSATNNNPSNAAGRNFVFPNNSNNNNASASSNVSSNNNSQIFHQQQHPNNNQSNNANVRWGMNNSNNNSSYFDNNNNNNSHYQQQQQHLNHDSYLTTNTTTTTNGVNVDPDDITAILSEIHTIDTRISRALRAHGDHIVSGSSSCGHHHYGHQQYHNAQSQHQRFLNSSASVLDYGGGNSSNTTIVFAP